MQITEQMVAVNVLSPLFVFICVLRRFHVATARILVNSDCWGNRPMLFLLEILRRATADLLQPG